MMRLNKYRAHNRKARAAEIRRYLLKEQGWDNEAVAQMSYDELVEMWDHYHEY